MMNERRKSDKPVLPMKSSNKAGPPVAESDGGKRFGQGEVATAKRVPDTEPERRAQCAGADTTSSKER